MLTMVSLLGMSLLGAAGIYGQLVLSMDLKTLGDT